MRLDTSSISFTRNEKKIGFNLPSELNEDLAYISGFIAGDGHIHFRRDKNEYHVICCGGLRDEKEFYDSVIIPLFKKLFNVKMKVRISRRDNTYYVMIFSRSLVKFFTDIIGIPSGKKSDIIRIPEIFKKDDKLLSAFVQGYADADFSVIIKKRYKQIPYYPVIEGCSKSKRILIEVSDFLEKNGFSVCKQFDMIRQDKRFKQDTIKNSIFIYGHRHFVKWMQTIGSRNPKFISSFNLWKERNKTNKRARSAFEMLHGSGEEI